MIPDFQLVDVPVAKQGNNRIFSYVRDTEERNYIGVDTETTRQIGQTPLSLQVAQYLGNNKFKALYVRNKKARKDRQRKTYKIQGYRVEVQVMDGPAQHWDSILNNLLKVPDNTLAFFNMLFDVPILYRTVPSEKFDGYWYFKARRHISLRRIPGKRTMILQGPFDFLDTQTLSKVLFGEHSLAGAASRILNLAKLDEEADGEIKYAVWDACLTSLLAFRLTEYLNAMNLNIRPDYVRSGGTFSKYLLADMGVRRPRFTNRDIYPFWRAFYGGKIESHPEYTKVPIEGDIIYADIQGQYAQAMEDANIMQFMTCEKIGVETLPGNDKYMVPDKRNACMAAKVEVDNAILPVKTVSKNLFPICKGEDIYMLPDIWAAKNLSLCDIEILEVYKPKAIGRQKVEPRHNLNPYTLVSDLIEQRKRAIDENRAHDNKFYKNVINTLYGLAVEGSTYKSDRMGVYANPVVASTITSYGRWLQSVGERFIRDHGRDVYYTHTDSFFMDKDLFKPLQEHMKTVGTTLTAKGTGKALIVVASQKYALFQDKKATKIARDPSNKFLFTLHGITDPPLLLHQRFYNLLGRNYMKAFHCFKEGESPWEYEFEGMDNILARQQSISTVNQYRLVQEMFKKEQIPQNVRAGMFFFKSYAADGTLLITPSLEMAHQVGEKTIELLLRKHFGGDDEKYNYKKKERWQINLNKNRVKHERGSDPLVESPILGELL